MTRSSSPASLTVVTISEAALADIYEHTHAGARANETGGLLLGHEHRHRITITSVGGPGPGAEHSPSRFRRDLAHAEKLAAEAFTQSRAVWVGEWHTHPDGPPWPSRRDLCTYRSFLSDEELRFTVFVALIVIPAPTSGLSGPTPDTSCWVLDDTTSTKTPLHVVPRPGEHASG